jgi:hypothetical protein
LGQLHLERVGPRSTAIQVYRQRKTEIRLGKFVPEEIKRKHRNATVAEIIEDYLKACVAKVGSRSGISSKGLAGGKTDSANVQRDRSSRTISKAPVWISREDDFQDFGTRKRKKRPRILDLLVPSTDTWQRSNQLF